MSKVLQFFCLFAQKFTENTTAKERKFPLRQLSPKQVYPMAIFPLLLFCRQLSHFGFPLTFKPSYNGHRTNRLNLPQWGGGIVLIPQLFVKRKTHKWQPKWAMKNYYRWLDRFMGASFLPLLFVYTELDLGSKEGHSLQIVWKPEHFVIFISQRSSKSNTRHFLFSFG